MSQQHTPLSAPPSTKGGCLLIAVGFIFCEIMAVSFHSGGVANFFGLGGFLLAIGGGIGWPLYVSAQKEKYKQVVQEQIAQEQEEQGKHLQPEQTTQATEEELPARDTTILGKHKDTGELVVVKDADRQSGMYVLGVQGVGKSSLLEQMIYQDIAKGYSVIVLDPHGDLIDHAIAQMPQERLRDTYLLDIEDVEYPFGVNLFGIEQGVGSTKEQQAHDRILHVFEKCFPDTSAMLLQKYLGNIAPVFFAHAQLGYGMTDIPRFLRDEAFRSELVKNKKVRLFVRQFWTDDYGTLSPSKRQTETASLATRINRFMRSPIVGNIIGQDKTTIDFRRAIEQKKIILIRLPVKTLPEDAALIGTMLVAQIHAAIFSFADTRLEDRPGFSLFVDEFQHFATSDFAEMFTEGRKFGSRVVVAHQFREQIPDYLAAATLTARTCITFQTTPRDAGQMAHLYPQELQTIQKEDIYPDVVKQLLSYSHPHPIVEKFIKEYLRPLQMMIKAQQIEVTTWEQSTGQAIWNAWQTPKPVVHSPMPLVSPLLYEAEIKQDATLPIPPEILYGFSNCGHGYYNTLDAASTEVKAYLSTAAAVSPQGLQRTMGMLSGPLEQQRQLIDFLVTLRGVMQVLVKQPLGDKKDITAAEIAKKIVGLPRRTAFVKIGTEIATMQTLDTPRAVSAAEVGRRKYLIVGQTRKAYCKPQYVVEEEIEKRQEAIQGVPPSQGAQTASPPQQEPQQNGQQGQKRRRAVEADED